MILISWEYYNLGNNYSHKQASKKPACGWSIDSPFISITFSKWGLAGFVIALERRTLSYNSFLDRHMLLILKSYNYFIRSITYASLICLTFIKYANLRLTRSTVLKPKYQLLQRELLTGRSQKLWHLLRRPSGQAYRLLH